MNILQLRLATACYALKSEENILANAETTIELMQNGAFLVRQLGKIVLIPAANVLFAICEERNKAK